MILSPTRTFSPLIKQILEQHASQIDGMIHNTGGGQTKVLHFTSGLNIIKDNLFETPPLFQMIQQQSQTSWEEMYKVFNMGNLLEFYTDEKTAIELIAIATAFQIEARIIGRVESGEGSVHILTPSNEFTYKH
jgi:phosphoribosylformylglycinamidine cyclo-ligase